MAAVLATSQAPSATDPVGGLLTYGPLGILCALFVFGLVVAGPTHKRALDEIDRLNTLIDEKVYPTVEANARATEQAITVLTNANAQAQAARPAPRKRATS